ncbi:PrsW family intramembrane metalloprotease [Corynebacterium aquilae]|uniref:PrsW family intramembrane metalloprotease n=1 Tax=Corynebacterium aquilae TaxID=203263 RepID=UPI000A00B141|nr:PrsW family intramembrane metalloprotease [Corynebacterium aquilae]
MTASKSFDQTQPVAEPPAVASWVGGNLPSMPARKTVGEYLLLGTVAVLLLGGVGLVAFVLLGQVLEVPDIGALSLLFVVAYVVVLYLVTFRFPGFRPRYALYGWLWGALACMVLVTAGGDAWARITSSLGWQPVAYSFAGAYPEEIAKGFGVVILLWLYGRRPWEGMIYGMWVGLGFEVVENYLYGMSGALFDVDSDVHGVLWSWMLRTVAGPGLHVVFVGFVGLGIGEVLLGDKSKWFYVLFGVFGHFVWNLQWDLFYLSLGAVAVVLYPTFIYLFVSRWKQARADVGRTYMHQYFGA